MHTLSKYKIRKLIATNKQLESFLKKERALCAFINNVYEQQNTYGDLFLKYIKCGNENKYKNPLYNSFYWDATPQNFIYWLTLYNKFNKYE